LKGDGPFTNVGDEAKYSGARTGLLWSCSANGCFEDAWHLGAPVDRCAFDFDVPYQHPILQHRQRQPVSAASSAENRGA
jgi:hypothetical protein